MDRVGFTDETPIEAGIISKSIERAQSKVENHNYEIRKQVLEYDDVMNKQREIIYAERRKVLEGDSLRDFMLQTLRSKVEFAVDEYASQEKHPSEWDLGSILDELELIFPIKETVSVEELETLDREGMKERLYAVALAAYETKEAEVTPEIMRFVESRYILLTIIDRMWVDHLYVMDALKTGIGLRGYGQKDPRVEYEKEAYEIFEDLKNNIADEAIKAAFAVRIERKDPGEENVEQPAAATNFESLPTGALIPQPAATNGSPHHSALDDETAEKLLGPIPNKPAKAIHTNRDEAAPAKPAARPSEKVGRNDLCPCGSGKKYKRCHGTAA